MYTLILSINDWHVQRHTRAIRRFREVYPIAGIVPQKLIPKASQTTFLALPSDGGNSIRYVGLRGKNQSWLPQYSSVRALWTPRWSFCGRNPQADIHDLKAFKILDRLTQIDDSCKSMILQLLDSYPRHAFNLRCAIHRRAYIYVNCTPLLFLIFLLI